MKNWLKISLLLCTFGFFREFRPSEPYVTEYLSSDYGNLTTEQIYQDVYPFGTYSVLAQLVIVFLITDLVRYKPVIVLSALAGITLFSLLIWTETVGMLQVAQIFFGTFTAAEVAYYTYMYAKVNKEQYQIVTGHTRAAILSGKFLGGLFAQVLVSTDSMNYRQLHYLSLTTQVISLAVSLFLPGVPRSLYFYASSDKNLAPGGEITAPKFSFSNACRLLWYHLVSSYSNPVVLKWSLWWALATCGQIQVISYIQFLWKEVAPDHLSVYNGGVEAVATLLGAIGAILAGLLNSNKRRGSYMLGISICAGILGALLIYAAKTHEIWVAYVNYVLFCAVFFFIITVAGAVVAENLVEDSFGLIFGINTLMGLLLQTILTIVVVEKVGLALEPRDQYVVYGSYFIVLAGIYIIGSALGKLFCRNRNSSVGSVDHLT
ncbi:LOW QUALITY PROTEIN: thiamine transporter 2 [Drosophila eugracilis]|uniref:LOW QUALITY PROTEIN: thiamine transporter 2 n=1 Tax=Drosophila eugracilis TaxID=29029 RepID=UPI001BD9DE8F|nr:LOW QUALITY PROTEIN: thiamine transporter 2 [Drosophila eugracilis]